MLKKRCGTVLPPTHQIILDLKQELLNLYESDIKFNKIEIVIKKLEFTQERLDTLDLLEGEDSDSRLKGNIYANSS